MKTKKISGESAETSGSYLNKMDLKYFRKLLKTKRAEALRELTRLEEYTENLAEADDADFSSLTHHESDVASDMEQAELNYQLMERAKKYIGEIDEALDRIEKGTYGICLATGKPISKKRLEASPHTRYSIEAKRSGLVPDD